MKRLTDEAEEYLKLHCKYTGLTRRQAINRIVIAHGRRVYYEAERIHGTTKKLN